MIDFETASNNSNEKKISFTGRLHLDSRPQLNDNYEVDVVGDGHGDADADGNGGGDGDGDGDEDDDGENK